MTLARLFSFRTSGLDESEAVLLARARQGQRRAFDDLLRRYEPALRGFIVRRVAPQAVDDVLQETLIACWTGLSQYAGRNRFKAWLYGIAIHKCQDFYRRQGQTTHQEVELPLDLPDSANAYRAIELREEIQDILRRLPDVQREVIELYYYAELTLPEIASVLNRNLNTVKYQFYRAHAQALESLKDQS